MNTTCVLLAAVMNQISRNRRHEIIRFISRKNQEWVSLNDETMCLPEGMTAKDYYNHLLHNGALQESDDGWVECPIPSFRQYILDFPNPGRTDVRG